MVSVSASSILIKLATAAPLVIAFYRLIFTVLLQVGPLALSRQVKMSQRDFLLSCVSGLFLAAHFATWFFSLRLTSVASSTVLVTTHPIVILAVGYLFRGEKITPGAAVGVGLAVLGAALVGWGDYRLDRSALLGDLLAFLGAITVAGYMLIGSQVRKRVTAMAYSTTAYASASLALLAAVLAVGNPLTGFAPNNWLLFVGLAVFPTVFGHTVFNWALKYLPASVISVTTLAEPLGASILAWLVWHTVPTQTTAVGIALLLAGIALFLALQRSNKSQMEGVT